MGTENRQSVFLHGLESSSKGTKARFLAEQFPQILIPDFKGNLNKRLTQLNAALSSYDSLILIGSSYGGLMATVFAFNQPNRVKELILLAPALNFPDIAFTDKSLTIKTTIFQGKHDKVCPHDEILAIANNVFSNLTFNSVDDDHMLHATFRTIAWHKYLD